MCSKPPFVSGQNYLEIHKTIEATAFGLGFLSELEGNSPDIAKDALGTVLSGFEMELTWKPPS